MLDIVLKPDNDMFLILLGLLKLIMTGVDVLVADIVGRSPYLLGGVLFALKKVGRVDAFVALNMFI